MSIICPTVALFVLAGAGLARAAPIQGDAKIQWASIPHAPATFDVQSVLNLATAMDPTFGPLLETAVAAGEIQFAEFSDSGNFGMHDWNTIALNPDYGPVVMAAAALHEFEHLRHATGPGSANGAGADNRSLDPCFPCTHMDMIAQSAEQIATMICSSTYPCEPICVAFPCEAVNILKDVAKSAYDRCKSTPGCNAPASFDDVADWDSHCPDYCQQ